MTINTRLLKSPAIAGLFACILLLGGCQTTQRPEEVTRLFWLALGNNDVFAAQKLASENSRDWIGKAPPPPWKMETLKVGEARIDGEQAAVETQVDYDRVKSPQTLRFDTFLVREHDAWKVDYRKTRDFMPLHPFTELLQNLRGLGEAFGEQLQQTLPQIEEGIHSFGEELNEQLKEMQRELEKAFPPPSPPKRPVPPPANPI